MGNQNKRYPHLFPIMPYKKTQTLISEGLSKSKSADDSFLTRLMRPIILSDETGGFNRSHLLMGCRAIEAQSVRY